MGIETWLCGLFVEQTDPGLAHATSVFQLFIPQHNCVCFISPASFETDNLPTVFLGIRPPFKPDFNVCAAELVYESTLRPHGEVLEPFISRFVLKGLLNLMKNRSVVIGW